MTHSYYNDTRQTMNHHLLKQGYLDAVITEERRRKIGNLQDNEIDGQVNRDAIMFGDSDQEEVSDNKVYKKDDDESSDDDAELLAQINATHQRTILENKRNNLTEDAVAHDVEGDIEEDNGDILNIFRVR